MTIKELFYKARNTEVIDQNGTPVAIVHPVTCSKKDARMMASFCAQQMNHEVQRKRREAAFRTSAAAIAEGRD